MKLAVIAFFNRAPMSMLYGYAEGDPLTRSVLDPLEFDVDSTTAAADAAFAALNDDARPNGRRERSLSVGDVVYVYADDDSTFAWFACETIGWREIDLDPMVSLDEERRCTS